MAEEQDQSQKTEEPTLKKLEDARKKGQGVNSREVTNLFMLVAAAIVVAVVLPGVMGDVSTSMRPFIAEPHLIKIGDGEAPGGLAKVGTSLLGALAAPLAIFVVAALAAGLVQRGFNVSAESMKPELKKISPLKGLKRMFSLRSFAEFAKGIAKLVIVGAVGVATIMPEMDSLELLTSVSTLQFMERIHELVLRLLVGVCSILALIAGLDYLYQRFEFMKQMRMSRQEIKDEYKPRQAALATLRAAPQTGHLGRGAGLIDEHQSAGIEIGLAFEPGQPARGRGRSCDQGKNPPAPPRAGAHSDDGCRTRRRCGDNQSGSFCRRPEIQFRQDECAGVGRECAGVGREGC